MTSDLRMARGRLPSGAVSPDGAISASDIVMRRVDDLRPNPRSARTHRKRKIKDLARAIKAVAFRPCSERRGL